MKRRVLRGGSYYCVTRSLRTSNCTWDGAAYRLRFSGFRIVVRRRRKQ